MNSRINPMYKTKFLAERGTRLATVLLGALLYLMGTSPSALAQSSSAATRGLAGFTTNLLARGDNSTHSATLGFGAKFYSVTPYTTAFVNNNGNLTFGSSLTSGTPNALNTITRPILAPFLADVDTSGAGSSSVTYGL